MNSHILITKRGYIPFFSSRKASRENFKIGYQQTSFICVLLIGLLGVYNVYSYNLSSTTSYEISEILAVNKDIQSKTERLSVVIADYESSNNVEIIGKKIGMIESGDPIYIEPDLSL